jgi:hypothetical protein
VYVLSFLFFINASLAFLQTKKELYDGLDPGECARWKKHEHRVSLADPQVYEA